MSTRQVQKIADMMKATDTVIRIVTDPDAATKLHERQLRIARFIESARLAQDSKRVD